jgi:hypothetical protein
MKKKPDLSKCTIEYGGEKYAVDLYGCEDMNAKGGLYDLAGKCAGFIVKGLDDDGYMLCTDEDMEQARNTARDAVYSLIKFYILRPLNRQIADQRGSEM